MASFVLFSRFKVSVQFLKLGFHFGVLVLQQLQLSEEIAVMKSLLFVGTGEQALVLIQF
jgi:hypothetical protein